MMLISYARVPDGLCMFCKHYLDNDPNLGFVCAAFPNGVPREIYKGRFDHRQPHPQDNGLRFELRDGYTIPNYVEEDYEQEHLYEEQARREELESRESDDDDTSAISPDYHPLL